MNKKSSNSPLLKFSIKQVFLFLSSLIKSSGFSKYKELKEQFFIIEKTLLKVEHKYNIVEEKLKSIEKKLFLSTTVNIVLFVIVIYNLDKIV